MDADGAGSGVEPKGWWWVLVRIIGVISRQFGPAGGLAFEMDGPGKGIGVELKLLEMKVDRGMG
jgi:hypothetical protein